MASLIQELRLTPFFSASWVSEGKRKTNLPEYGPLCLMLRPSVVSKKVGELLPDLCWNYGNGTVVNLLIVVGS